MTNMDEVYYYERLRSTEAPTNNGAGVGWIVFGVTLGALTLALC